MVCGDVSSARSVQQVEVAKLLNMQFPRDDRGVMIVGADVNIDMQTP